MGIVSPTATAAQQRAWNYWFEDGLPVLVGGFGLLFFGASMLFDHSLFRLVLFGLYCVILLRHRMIIEWLKVRLTYPRTGYVTPPRSSQDELPPSADLAALSLQADPEKVARAVAEHQNAKKRMIPVLALLLPAVLGTMFINRPWSYAAAGVALALALWIMNGKEFRLAWIAIGGIPLIGLYMAVFPLASLTPAHRIGFFTTACGLFIVANGAVGLAIYLWRNPVARVRAE